MARCRTAPPSPSPRLARHPRPANRNPSLHPSPRTSQWRRRAQPTHRPAHPRPPEPVAARVPAEPPATPPPSAGLPSEAAPAAPAAPHLPTPPSMPTGGGLPAEAPASLGEVPHGGEPAAHPPEPPGGGAHPPSDGNVPHPPGDGVPTHEPSDKPPGEYPPHDAPPSDDPAEAHPPEVPAPSDLQPWHQEQLARAVSPQELVRDLIEHGCPRELAESAAHSPYEGMNAQEILNRFWDPAEGTWKWPEHNGFADGKWETARSIPEDKFLDRIGEVSNKRGDFMGEVGDSYPHRGLAPGSSGDYNRFHGTGKDLPEGWEVRYGKVADAFGQPGGGTQWVVVDKNNKIVLIKWLLENGYLAP